MKPQPSGGFEWVQAAGGPALVCGALRPFADHLFTTREWALGSRARGGPGRRLAAGRPPASASMPGTARAACIRCTARRWWCGAPATAVRPAGRRARCRHPGLERSVAGARHSDRGLRAAADRRSRDRRGGGRACGVARACRRRAGRRRSPRSRASSAARRRISLPPSGRRSARSATKWAEDVRSAVPSPRDSRRPPTDRALVSGSADSGARPSLVLRRVGGDAASARSRRPAGWQHSLAGALHRDPSRISSVRIAATAAARGGSLAAIRR